jgi:hypothetical protein
MRVRRFLHVAVLAATFLLAPAIALAASMTFRAVAVVDSPKCGARCAQVIVAEGEITERTPEDFLAFVRSQQGNRAMRGVVVLNSHGGRVMASMELGHVFRAAQVSVIVARPARGGLAAGRCYSACVYALMGARKRVIPNESRVGIHRMFAYERFGADSEEGFAMTRVYATPDMVARLGDYAGTMGVSRELIYVAERVTPDRVRIVTPREIRRWRLGTNKF